MSVDTTQAIENESENEEYQYASDEFVNEYAAEPEPSEQKRSFLRRFLGSKIAIVLIIMLAVFVVYKILLHRNHSELSQEKASVATQTQEQTSVPTSIATTPKPQQLSAQVEELLAQQLNALRQQEEKDVTRIQSLQNGIQQTNQNIRQLERNLLETNKTLQQLATQFDTLNQKITTKPPSTPKPTTAPKKQVIMPKKVYNIKAILPGRAWLESNAGEWKTVEVGNKLQGYGTVTAIYPDEGEVVTSTGGAITYDGGHG